MSRGLLLFVVVFTANVITPYALQHSSMWSINGPDGAGWADLTFAIGDLPTIQNNSDHFNMKALYPLQWTVGQKNKCYAPVKHCQTTPDGYFNCITIDPDYKQSWKNQFVIENVSIMTKIEFEHKMMN